MVAIASSAPAPAENTHSQQENNRFAWVHLWVTIKISAVSMLTKYVYCSSCDKVALRIQLLCIWFVLLFILGLYQIVDTGENWSIGNKTWAFYNECSCFTCDWYSRTSIREAHPCDRNSSSSFVCYTLLMPFNGRYQQCNQAHDYKKKREIINNGENNFIIRFTCCRNRKHIETFVSERSAMEK